MNDSKKRRRNDFLLPFNVNANIPPLTHRELMGVVLDILGKESLRLPFDSLFLFHYIKRLYRHVDYSSFTFSKLKINDIIRELIENKILTCEEMFINMKRCYYVKQIDYERLKPFVMNLTDCEVNPDYDKYQEKAKTIMQDVLKETVYEYDKDDLLQYNEQEVKRHQGDRHIIFSNSMQSKGAVEVENYDEGNASNSHSNNPNDDDDLNFINNMLYAPTAKVMMNSSHYAEDDLLPLDSTLSVLAKMKSKYGSSLRPFCEFGVLSECQKKTKGMCKNVHFRPIIESHTDVSLGDCSYLDTCRHMEICKFVHYQIEDDDLIPSNRKELVLSGDETVLDSQWVNCDIRYFDFSILGKFDVIMADPPWDIHMDLPYGTLSDEEMKNLKVGSLQDDGIIFLWVTGRATELARECLELWGYERKEELVWIKTNQLQRLIRTGRTGHWLNHSKEHCLIGYKGNPKLNRNVDCDVLVSEVRETSRKPDEIYELIERMRPGGRKLELFARAHNRRKGWISLGNQLPGVYFVEPELIDRFNQKYPESRLTKEIMEKNKESSILKKTTNNS